MKRASISINMLVVIVIALVAMTIFLVFFTGKSAGLFSTWGQVEPTAGETSDTKCILACNKAKLASNCMDWENVFCEVQYGDTGKTCWQANDLLDKKFCKDTNKPFSAENDKEVTCGCPTASP